MGNIQHYITSRQLNPTIWLVVILLLLTSCDRNRLTQMEDDGIILAFGDSLTVGVGTSPATAYPSILSELSGHAVINAGVSGETTSEGLGRWPEIIEQTAPQLIILLEGGNDILRNKNHQKIKQNLAEMIEYAQEKQIEVVLIGVPAKNILFSVAPFYNELAKEYSLIYSANLLPDLLRDANYKSDAIHLNEKGYHILAQSIHEMLIAKGALTN